jgi:hypothetical protein
MLESFFDQIAELFDPDAALHAADDSHALDEDDADREW